MRLVQLCKKLITDIDDFVSVKDLEPLLGNGGHFPFGVVVSIGFIHVDDVLA